MNKPVTRKQLAILAVALTIGSVVASTEIAQQVHKTECQHTQLADMQGNKRGHILKKFMLSAAQAREHSGDASIAREYRMEAQAIHDVPVPKC